MEPYKKGRVAIAEGALVAFWPEGDPKPMRHDCSPQEAVVDDVHFVQEAAVADSIAGGDHFHVLRCVSRLGGSQRLLLTAQQLEVRRSNQINSRKNRQLPAYQQPRYLTHFLTSSALLCDSRRMG